MESVEIWMWMIAGILISGIILVGSFSFMGNYFESQEKSVAKASFLNLHSSIQETCLGPRNFEKSVNIIFPYNVLSIYQDSAKLCIETKDDQDPYCKELPVCAVSFSPQDVILTDEDSFFAIVQKALGKKDNANIKFTISKTDSKEVSVNWKEELLKD